MRCERSLSRYHAQIDEGGAADLAAIAAKADAASGAVLLLILLMRIKKEGNVNFWLVPCFAYIAIMNRITS